ncbi:MAG: RHS repeat-associated core domain-containing protein [Cyclobacteriaceae bacterium]
MANESAGTHVFFDDFTVKQLGVDITQTTDYYPFGSIMSHWQKENYRFGYQGEFAEEDDETGFNHFALRLYDSKILRWNSIDPYRQYASPYIGMGNNPVYLTDPDGGCTDADGKKVPCGGDTFYTIESSYLDDVTITASRSILPRDVPSWMKTRHNVEFEFDVYAKIVAGDINYEDYGPLGVSMDRLSADVIKIGFSHTFKDGKGTLLENGGYYDYFGKNNKWTLNHGGSAELGIDGKYKGSVTYDSSNGSFYISKLEAGLGAPFVELKTIRDHSSHHTIRLGVQEEWGKNILPGVAWKAGGFMGFHYVITK